MGGAYIAIVTEPARYRLVRTPVRAARTLLADDAQRRVIDHAGGPLLVLAGPGTGKTATIVEAVAERIGRRGVDPAAVLLLTFSRRAAAELRARISARVGMTVTEPLARTFHSYAFGLLRDAAVLRGAPAPRLLTVPEQDVVIRELLAGELAGAAGSGWPADLLPALPTRGFADELLELLMRAVERGIGPAGLSRLGREQRRPDWVAAARFMQQYMDVTALSDSAAYDPAELIRAATELLRGDPELLARERARRRYVFVDEYQDTDPGQGELLRLIAGGAVELVVVGDPDQSIYSFRGADVRCIRRFPDEFAGPDGAPAPSVALGVSRRSGPALLAASRRVAARLTGPAAHRRLAASPAAPAGTMQVRVLRSVNAEAVHIATTLRAAHLRDGIAWRDMAVLMRSTSRSLGLLQRALATAGVPTGIGRGDLPLAGQPAVRGILTLLQVALGVRVADAQTVQEMACSAYGGADGLGLRRLRRALRTQEWSGGGRRRIEELLVDAVDDPVLLARIDPAVAAPLRRIAELVATARDAAARPAASAEDVLWALWSASGLAQVWGGDSLRGGPAGAAADRNLDGMLALFDAAAGYADRLPGSRPAGFAEYLRSQQIPGDSLAESTPLGDAVALLTAHSAKGLQWRLVVVAGVNEGVWPDLRQRGSLLGSEELVDLTAGRASVASPAPLLDEERRLFYVAVTRARERLLVTAVGGDDQRPSRFLDELDPLPRGEDRLPTDAGRALSLPAVVAELRATVTDAESSSPTIRWLAARQLARLARAGVAAAHPDQWWGCLPLSDERPLRVADEKTRISPSMVETFELCEVRWFLESVGGRDADRRSRSLGIALHEVIAWSMAEPRPSEADLGRRLDELLDEADLGSPWFTAQQRAKAHDMLKRYRQWAHHNPRTFGGAEVEIAVPCTDSTDHSVVVGRVDRIDVDEAGRVAIVDFKTGSTPPSVAQAARNPQLGVYQWAASRGSFGHTRRTVEAVDPGDDPGRAGGGTLLYLGAPSLRAGTRSQLPLADDPDPDWARALVRAAADGMSGAGWLATPGPGCRTCPVRSCCPAIADGRLVGGDDPPPGTAS